MLTAFAVLVACGAFLTSVAEASAPANGRAWELITPGEPIGAKVAAATPVNSSGDRMIYETLGPLPGAPSGEPLSFAQAVRGEQGWLTTPVGFPYSLEQEPEFAGFVKAIFPILPAGPVEGELPPLWLSIASLGSEPLPAGHAALYRRGPGSTFTMVADLGELPNLLTYQGYVDQSEDGTHVVFSATEHLLPSDAGRTEGWSIYESVGTALRQVDVGNNGQPVSPCKSLMSHHNGVSSDGERIFFTNPAPSSSCPGPSEVYLREGGIRTVEVSASQCTRPDCNSPADVAFAGATPDGESVFMTTTQQLTNEDHDSSRDLYRYDVDDEKLTLLSGGSPSGEGSVMDASVHSSDNGEYVYFYSSGALESGEGEAEGREDLYVVDPSGLHFIVPASLPSYGEFEEEFEDSLQLSRNGQVALFDTSAAGEEDDTDGRSDVYLYHANDASLKRLSTGPSGGNGPYDATIYTTPELRGIVVGRPYLYRSLSENGEDAFFTTEEALVPEDLNTSTDLYEWKEGHVGLVSSGTGSQSVIFEGASADGKTAFFLTSQTLLPADRDGGERDIYAARVGGGFNEASPSATAGCEASSCQPRARTRLARLVPASAIHDNGNQGIRLIGVTEGRSRGGDDLPILLVAVPSAGRVSVVGTRLGKGGRTVARGGVIASRPGRARIPLRLSGALVRALAREAVKVRLVIREGGLELVRTITLPGRSR